MSNQNHKKRYISAFIIMALLALLISAASFCAGRKQAQGQVQEQVQEPSGAIDPLKVTGAEEKQTQEQTRENPYKQEEYVDSCQQIDLGAKSLKISNVKLVKEVDMENIHIEYPYLNNAGDEPSRKINEQIYDQIIYYGGGAKKNLTDNDGIRTDADIAYHITYVDDNIISILFSGDIAGGMSYNYVNVGLNFNLQSGGILSIADFYELAEIRDLVQKAVSEEKLLGENQFGENLPLDGEKKEIYFNDFLSEFDTDDYINRTDNFFIKDGSVCFIASPPPSFKEGTYIELEVEEMPTLKIGQAQNNVDSWLGEYVYVETFPHDDDGPSYFIGITITIYEQDGDFYAQINGDGWFLETRSLAKVTGDEDSIDITFLENAVDDPLYERNIQRYEYGEELVHFERLESGEINTEWKSLRDQHPFSFWVDADEEISGIYFAKEDSTEDDIDEQAAIEKVCEKVRTMDFTANQPQMDITSQEKEHEKTGL